MKEEQKKQYYENYSKEKQKGVKFWPDIILKDVIVTLAIFLVLLGLAVFVGVAYEPPADPNDTSYIPRPEWYFLFLFEMLKYFPGQLEWIGTFILPSLAVAALFLLPFLDRNPKRHWKNRKFAVVFMTVVVIGMVALTIMAFISTPPQEEAVQAQTISEKVALGEELYAINCVECHGADGEGGEIKGVEGLEGVVLDPINSEDVMYTFTDETLYNIIDYGQPNLGMPPFGLGHGGELQRGEIDAIVQFMRYTWDDRVELPEDQQVSTIPLPAAEEVPSYEVHVAPIFKRYCLSCHRPGRDNNNYLMETYEEVINSGDNAPVMVAGDMNSIMIRVLNREEITELDIGPMPPNKALKQEYIDVIIRWIMAGMPETAADAAAVQP
jgi:mono/diheme cytochrome c family protein